MKLDNLNKKIIQGMILLQLCTIAVYANTLEEAESSSEASKIKLERHFVFDSIPQNLEEIIKSSGKIFAGKCKSVEEIDDDSESRLPVVKYVFKITEGIKGVKGKDEITFKQWQPTSRSASYETGKKYVLFLYPESERGLTTPIALEQGLFKVQSSGIIRRSEVVKNALSNKGLNRNLKSQKKISIDNDKFVNDYIHECSENGAPMRYKEFIKAVKYLVEKEQ